MKNYNYKLHFCNCLRYLGLPVLLLFITSMGFAQFNGGTGTPEDPFQIANVTQLQAMNTGLDKHYVLTQNIDASVTSTWNSGAGFEPIGATSGPTTSFTGTFDGKGYVISKLYINRPSGSGVGLFGNAFTFNSNVVSIANVGLDSVYVKGSTRVGALVGNKDLVMRNCYSSGTVEGAGENVGGLVGRNGLSELSNSHSSCTVNGANNAGGLAGSGGNIKNCYATGNVTGTSSVGGLIGGISSVGGLVYNSYATGNVTPTVSNIAGGLIGRVQNGFIDLCYSSSVITGNKIGGLIGMCNAGTIKRSYSTATLISSGGFGTIVGGLIAENEAKVIDCYTNVKIVYTGNDANTVLSGLIGRNQDHSEVSNSYAVVTYNATSGSKSGLVGTNELSNQDTATIKNCYWNIDSSGAVPGIANDQTGVQVVTGLSDVQMRKQTSFPLWNFDTTWNIIENQSYPFHRIASAPCVNTSATDSIRACKSYTWINGLTYTNSTDTVKYIIPNAAGCDSIIILKLTIDTINTDVSLNANILSATESAAGTTYQWINCDTNKPIANATNQTYTVTVTGNYAVIVSNNSCVDTSACNNVVVLGIEKFNSKEIDIYPNPSSSIINFKLTQKSEVKIIDALGRVIFTSTLESGDQKLNISNFDNGVYVLCVRNEENYFVSKFILQK